jgi:hypothetical protein
MTKLSGGRLFEFWKRFKRYGMQKEIENVIEVLWNLEKEIKKQDMGTCKMYQGV